MKDESLRKLGSSYSYLAFKSKECPEKSHLRWPLYIYRHLGKVGRLYIQPTRPLFRRQTLLMM